MFFYPAHKGLAREMRLSWTANSGNMNIGQKYLSDANISRLRKKLLTIDYLKAIVKLRK
jgi:hypothetical protein